MVLTKSPLRSDYYLAYGHTVKTNASFRRYHTCFGYEGRTERKSFFFFNTLMDKISGSLFQNHRESGR